MTSIHRVYNHELNTTSDKAPIFNSPCRGFALLWPNGKNERKFFIVPLRIVGVENTGERIRYDVPNEGVVHRREERRVTGKCHEGGQANLR